MSQLVNRAVFDIRGLEIIRRISAITFGIFLFALSILNSYASESDWMQYGGHEGGAR